MKKLLCVLLASVLAFGGLVSVSSQAAQGQDDEWLNSAIAQLEEAPQQQGFAADDKSQLKLLNAYMDDEGTYTLALDPASMDYLLSATFTLLMNEGEGVHFDLGEDDELTIDAENGLIQDSFDGMWTALSDGQLLSLYLLEQNDAYNIYSAPVKLNGRETNLRILYDFDAEAFQVISRWDSISESGTAGKEIVKVKVGDVIISLYEAYDAETGDYLRLDEGSTYIAEDSFTIEYMQLPPADYYYSFTLTDLYGLKIYTDFVVFTLDEAREIWFYQE